MVLIVALAVMLLIAVSVTAAYAASTAPLIHGIKRDLSALHVQLEEIDPWREDAGRRSVAFNADLGDGSPTFRRLSMVTIARAANRRLERLATAYQLAGDHRRARTTQGLRLVMYDLQHKVDRLARADDAATAVVLRNQVDDLLGRAERSLDVLLRDAESSSTPQTAEAELGIPGIETVEPAAPPLVVRGGAARP